MSSPSSSEDFMLGESSDEKQRAATSRTTKRTSRTSKTPNYMESSAESDGDDSDEVQFVATKKKTSPKKKRVSPKVVKQSVLESLSDGSGVKEGDGAKSKVALQDEQNVKPAALQPSKITSGVVTESADSKNDGINVLIPHALLNKHQGAGKGECTMLVQVEGDDHQLDFLGQSGAVGRFEADEEGVTLDLKGFQYRGIIRPGPTAMVIALTRDNQFKVEAITDEFVTLDTERTNMMDKFDAIVEGDMDDGYKVTDDNVNSKKKGNDENEEIGVKGTKRKVKGGGNTSVSKKQKVATSKK